MLLFEVPLSHSDYDGRQYDGAGPYEEHHQPVFRVKQVSFPSGIALGPRPMNEKVFQNLPVIRGSQWLIANLTVDRLNLYARDSRAPPCIALDRSGIRTRRACNIL